VGVEASASFNLALALTVCLSDSIIVFVSTGASVHKAKHACGQMMTCRSVPTSIGAMLTQQIRGKRRNHKSPEVFTLMPSYLLSDKKRRI
jgi:hypothetical protein